MLILIEIRRYFIGISWWDWGNPENSDIKDIKMGFSSLIDIVIPDSEPESRFHIIQP